ncbi:MAG: EamA family transporter RarD [Elusimicrobiota bacterium]|nr:EamA family transporter RarD [Elusimicrobiota bacterium]
MNRNLKLGFLCGVGAYFIWGLFPLYWKQMTHISSLDILANRFIWSAVFSLFLILVSRNLKSFCADLKFIFSNRKRAIMEIAAAVTVTFNWGVFIYAVNSGQILASSLGYYINPLVSVLFGMLFLKEILTKRQGIAVFFAFLGTAIMVWQFRQFPWIAIVLAVSFAIYGLIKKQLPISSLSSIAVESSLISPIAIGYEYYSSLQGGVYHNIGIIDLSWLIGAGIVTAIPLILFTSAAKKLPLKTMGFLQYICPTLSMLIGIFIYRESFTISHLAAFGSIWLGIIIFSIPHKTAKIKNTKTL